jgi:hypothetical protein
LETVRALVVKAHLENCNVGCPACPAAEGQQEKDTVAAADGAVETITLIAAE